MAHMVLYRRYTASLCSSSQTSLPACILNSPCLSSQVGCSCMCDTLSHAFQGIPLSHVWMCHQTVAPLKANKHLHAKEWAWSSMLSYCTAALNFWPCAKPACSFFFSTIISHMQRSAKGSLPLTLTADRLC